MKRKECDNPTRIRRWPAVVLAMAWLTPYVAGDARNACAAGRAADAGKSVRVWSAAVVSDDEVALKHVCDLSGVRAADPEALADTAVVRSPGVGEKAVVTLDQIQDALRRGGVNLASVVIAGASRCTVTRAEPVDDTPNSVPAAATPGVAAIAATPPDGPAAQGRTLRDAVRRVFESYARQHGGRIELQFARTSEEILNLAEPRYRFDVRLNGGRWLGRMVKLEVDVWAGERKVQTVPLVVNASIVKKIVIARRPIGLEATIIDEDVQLSERAHESLENAAASDLDAVIGLRARTFIPAGRAVHLDDLEQVPLVTRGQVVDVISMVGGIEARKAGKAVDGGSLGDVVEVRVGGRRGDVLTGIVTGKRRVMVGAVNEGLGFGALSMAWGDNP